MIGFTEIQTAFTVIIALFAVVATVWGGIRSIREAISPLSNLISEHHDVAAITKTNAEDILEIKSKLANYDEYFRKDRQRLDDDREDLNNLKRSNALVLRGINQLIEHELNGGKSEEDLKQTHKDITDYLVNRV